MREPLLRVDKLQKYFPVYKNVAFVFKKTTGWVKAVDGIDFVIYPHESLGLVGESGCGKTTTSMLILKLDDPTSGSIWFHGKDIAKLKGAFLKEYRHSVQAMFQDPYSSLNPRMRIGTSIGEPLLVNGVPRNETRERVMEALLQVGLDKGAYTLFPHEFSGGQRQRIALARSIILKPDLVVLDEPVSALDVSVRAQVMNLLKSIQESLGLSYLMIAHHLGTIRYLCHWVGVMYLGKIVELSTSEELFTHPMHPYTVALLSATLPSHPDLNKPEIVLPGEVPSPVNIPSGCRFHVRCLKARKDCFKDEPILKQVNNKHFVACSN
jgi:oligopeptide/dipeptide ABC transporter ATP-binding protein